MRTDGQTEGQADGHDKANTRFSQFCDSAYKTLHIRSVLRRVCIKTLKPR
jgi:hypothetical protein